MMQIHLDTSVSDRFYSCKCRYKEHVSDNQFLAVLIGHFENCSLTQDLLSNEPIWTEHFNNNSDEQDMEDTSSVSSAALPSQTEVGSGRHHHHHQHREQQLSDSPPPPRLSSATGEESTLPPSEDLSRAHLDDRINGSYECQQRTPNGSLSPATSPPPRTGTPEEPDSNTEEPRRPTSSPMSPPSPVTSPLIGSAGKMARWSASPERSPSPGPTLFACPICNIAFAEENAYNRHIASHVTASIYPFPCQLCGDKFASQETLLGHLFTAHADDSEVALLRQHAAPNLLEVTTAGLPPPEDSKAMPRLAPIPTNTSPSPGVGGTDVLLQQQPERYRCACGMQFSWPEQFSRHRSLCSIATGRDFLMMEKEMEDAVSVSLPRQLMLSAAAGSTSSATTTTITATTVNSSTSSSALDLSVKTEMSALPTILGQSVCPECKYAAPSRDALFAHFETEHKLEGGSFSCTCGNMFDRLPNFLRHYVACPIAATDLHGGDSGMGFHHHQDGIPSPLRAVQAALRHMPLRFLPDSAAKMIFACPRCGQQFHQHQDMARHLSHCQHHQQFPLVDSTETTKQSAPPVSGVLMPPPIGGSHPSQQNHQHGDQPRPFKCTYCIKSFKSKALLDQHMHIHYPPKYTCRFCGKKYRWPPVFYHHQRTCKKRPPTSSSQSLSSSGAPPAAPITSNVGHLGLPTPPQHHMSQHHIPKHHQNGFSGSALSNSSLPPPPLGMKPPAPNGMPTSPQTGNNMSQLSCLCGFKFDDLTAYVAHVNSCQVLLARLASPVRPPHPMAAMLPHHMSLLGSPHTVQHSAMLAAQQQQQQQQHQQAQQQHAAAQQQAQQQQNSAAMMAAVAAAMSQQQQQHPTSVGQSISPTLLSSSMALASAVAHSHGGSPRMDSPSLHSGLKRLASTGGLVGSGCNLCSQCGKEFSSRLSLKQHMEGKHSAEGKYLCPGCGKRYRWGASYYYHKKSCPAAKDMPSGDLKSPGLPGMPPLMVLPPGWDDRERELMSASSQMQLSLPPVLTTSCTK